MPRPPSRSKYGSVKTTLDGITFASKAEALRYAELKLLQRAGLIANLVIQPRFPLVVSGVLVATYIADFSYTEEKTQLPVVEDVKSPATRTDVYRLKIKLLHVLHGIRVSEIQRS
jgi:hypothetical protein